MALLRDVAVLALLGAGSLTLHGCGGGDSPEPDPHSNPDPSPNPSPGPSPGPGPAPQPGPGPRPGPEPSPEDPDASTTTAKPEPCSAFGDRLDIPDTAIELNGVSWPPACYDEKDKHHVFIIGDWGGMCGYGRKNDCRLSPEEADASWDKEDHSRARPYPMKNKRGRKSGVDDMAQQLVRDRMTTLSERYEPEFIINVGDSFYPGGIVDHCMGKKSDINFDEVPHQFQTTYEDMYNGSKLMGKEWLSVLGNHDYGGVCFNMGWPQQIWYTWNTAGSQRWIMPAQYYFRQARFTTKSGELIVADMWFLDSNFEDTNRDEPHDICSAPGNYHLDEDETNSDRKNGWHCKNFLGDWQSQPDKAGVCEGTALNSRASCIDNFKSLWLEQMKWLEEGLKNSHADWQIIVTHFPGYYEKLADHLVPLCKKYGVDAIISGHVHSQELWYQQRAYGFDFHDTALLISGGGGGILSEATPDDHGNDNQYGFMDMTVTKDTLDVTSYSWADTKYGQIILDTDVAKCAGQYREQKFGPTGTWIKYTHYQGQCVMYFNAGKHANPKGWVLKDGQEVNKDLPWYCAGGNVNNLVQTKGEWTVNTALGNVSRCSLSFPVGNLIPKQHQVIKKAYPADRPRPGCKGGTLTACNALCGDDFAKTNDGAVLLKCMNECTAKCVNSGDTNDYPEPDPEPAPAPAPASASCENKCGQPYTPGAPCQCNADCAKFGSCCADYANHCSRTVV